MDGPSLLRSAPAALIWTLWLTTSLAHAQMGMGVGMGAPPVRPGIQNDQTNRTIELQQASDDRVFVRNAIQDVLFEAQSAQIALDKSRTPETRQFAGSILRQQTIADASGGWQPIAKRLGVAVPDQVTKANHKEIEKLSSLSGDSFDEAYIKAQLREYRQKLLAFQEEAAHGSDMGLKDAAAEQIPAIQKNVKLAELMARDQGVDAKKSLKVH